MAESTGPRGYSWSNVQGLVSPHVIPTVRYCKTRNKKIFQTLFLIFGIVYIYFELLIFLCNYFRNI